jgi:hypothetical protein
MLQTQFESDLSSIIEKFMNKLSSTPEVETARGLSKVS